MKPTVQIPALIHTLQTLADGSIKITVVTREISDEHAAKLFGYRKEEGYMLFKPAPFEDADVLNIPETVPEFRNEKSPSQRLRNVQFLVWRHKGEPGGSFDTWRKEEMEKIITHYKEKLP